MKDIEALTYNIEIHMCDDSDIYLLEKHIPSPGKSKFHEERLQQQKDGLSTYLIAWNAGTPVGHLLIRWQGFGVEMPEKHKYTPELNSFVVAEDMQGKGIGTKLIQEVENIIASKGIEQAGILVNPANFRALALYERMGYKDTGTGIHVDCWKELDNNGKAFENSEECLALVKQLL